MIYRLHFLGDPLGEPSRKLTGEYFQVDGLPGVGTMHFVQPDRPLRICDHDPCVAVDMTAVAEKT
jgi:hypothetical protein